MMVRNLHKLRGRSRAELAERAAQWLAASAERLGVRDAHEITVDQLARRIRPSAFGGRDPLGGWFDAHVAGRTDALFPGLADHQATVSALRDLVPDAEGDVVSRAERMLAGDFDLLGHRGVHYALPIDWHCDPISGVRAPAEHWSRIAYLDPGVAGDHKALWEINRHQILVTLGQAWWYTGDERFANAAAHWVTTWMDDNPPKIGVNWASSLEIAFRAMSWCWLLQMTKHAVAFDERLFTRMIGHLYRSARHLERYLSTWFSPNTHLTGEALGLYVIGRQLAPLADAERWRRTGLEVLLEQLPRHVRSDGVYFEQSTYYQRYTCDFYLQLLVLTEGPEPTVAARIRERLRKAVECLQAITRPDGTMPLIGDDDGGRLLFLDGRSGADVRSCLATAAVLFGRGDFAWVAQGPSSEIVWLLGPQGAARWRALDRRPPTTGSRAFLAGGLVTMRNGWSPTASLLVFDGGPHGIDNCGHSHADALAFDLTANGIPVFVDPGTCTYTTSPAWRDAFRSTIVHNAVALNGESSSEMSGPFSWRSQAHSTIERFLATPLVDYVEGTHDGYERPGIHAEVVRGILFVKDGYWIIRDRVVTAARLTISTTLQCAPGLRVAQDGATATVSDDSGKILHVHQFGPALDASLVAGWVSPAYGVKVEAPCLRATTHVVGGATIETVLVLDTLTATVHRRRGRASDVMTVESRAYHDVAVFADGGDHPIEEGVATDADVFWLRRDAVTGLAVSVMASGATYLQVDGENVASAELPSAFAACRNADGWRMHDVEGAATAIHHAPEPASHPLLPAGPETSPSSNLS